MGTNVTGGSAGAGHVMGSTPMPSTHISEGRLTIGDIACRFDLEVIGDAWAMVFENDWEHEADETGKWWVQVPEDFTL